MLFVFFLDVLGLVFLTLLELLEILHILHQNLIALFEGTFSIVSLSLQILDLIFDDSMGHGDQKHLLLLLENIDKGLVLAH